MESNKSIITVSASSCALDPLRSCTNAKDAADRIRAFNAKADELGKQHFTPTSRGMIGILTTEYFMTALDLDATLNELEEYKKNAAALSKRVEELTEELEAREVEEYKDVYDPIVPTRKTTAIVLPRLKGASLR